MNIATAIISAALLAGPHDVPPVLPIPDALEICAGLRHAAGLPPPRRRTISILSG